MPQILMILHILIALALIVLVMLQQGRGAEAGAAFGGGGADTVFGSRGPTSFLTRLTAFLVALFFVTSLGLGRVMAHQAKNVHLVTIEQPMHVA